MGEVVEFKKPEGDRPNKNNHPSRRKGDIPSLEIMQVAEWLMDHGYPDEWAMADKPPDMLREALAVVIAEREGKVIETARRSLSQRLVQTNIIT